MPGMSTGLSANNPEIVAAFQGALLHQGLVVLVIVLLVGVAWSVMRSAQLRRASAHAKGAQATSAVLSPPEPVARRLLRISFGLIWLFDGILQGQAAMPLGMGPLVIEPAAVGSPSWVVHLANSGTTIWNFHPVAAAAATVWIQAGIGVWLLVGARGTWSRLAGVASVAWGLMVWSFGEAFGGIFAPSLSWLTGAPGGVVFYCVAGALVALPEQAWLGPRLGKIVLRGTGLFFMGMALLQAWPGRGYWQGQAHPGTTAGSLTSMVQEMAQTPQPHLISSWLSAFGSFDARHGWAVNLFAVIALAAIGAAFLIARRRVALFGVVAGAIFCLATWVLVQDFGFFGGVGTDPNSMVPMAVLFTAGYLALAKAPVAVEAGDVVPITAPAPAASLWGRLSANPSYTFRSVAALGALGVTLIGVVPMGLALLKPHAGTVLAQAIDGAPEAIDKPAPSFSLVDQYGKPVSLASLRGKTVALTILDDTCTSDCPVIAHELLVADKYLGANARHVELVAINANPRYVQPDYLAAFDQQEGLQHMANWQYLTGSLPELRRVWGSYGFEVEYLPAGAMIGHSEFAYIIDAKGDIRYDLDTDPGPATRATSSSFAGMLAGAIKTVLRTQ